MPLVGNKCAFIYLASVYEEKKIVMLKFLQSICTPEGIFPPDLMSLMKDFCESDPSLKASTKVSQIIIKLFKCDVQFKGGERWSRCMDEDEKVIQLVMIG